MPADIVNLNKFKKAKERGEQEKRAEENRAKYGRTKEERCKEEDEAARRDTLLDGARRETPAKPNVQDSDGEGKGGGDDKGGGEDKP